MPSCFGFSGSVRAPTQYQSAKCADVQLPAAFDLLGLQLHVRGVAARVRLAVADRELDFGGEHQWQELAFQLLAAMADQGFPDDADALADLRRCVPRERLVEDVLVDAWDLLAAVLLRPRHPEPALRGELLHERAPLGRVRQLREVLPGRVHHDRVVVLDQPALDLIRKLLLFGREIEVHGGLLGQAETSMRSEGS
jgi:hypothetical protein